MKLQISPLLLSLSLVVGLAPGCGTSDTGGDLPQGSKSEPDILLISIDTLRPDHLGLYGADRETSPFLDAMANDGVVFEDAWAPAPWTLPSHATMLTGRMPAEHGAIEENRAISEAMPLLPEALTALGYRSAAFITTPFVGARYGFDRGFDHFEELLADDFSLETAVDADSVTSRALGWAQNLPEGTPAFAFLHLYDAHYPCDAPAPFNTKFNRQSSPEERHYENYFYYQKHPPSVAAIEHQMGQYDEEIAFVDATLREFCTAWTRDRPNTIFVVVSDHGEEFGERGSWGHGHTLTPEQLHVPWIIWGAGIQHRRIDQRVGLEDLAPTLAALAGTHFGPGAGIDRSVALLEHDGDPGRPGGAFASTSRRNTLKLRLHSPPFDIITDLRRREVRLYDLRVDPMAGHDISREKPEQISLLWGGMIATIGLPWTTREARSWHTDGVVIARDGRLLTGDFELDAGLEFALWPLDAALETQTASGETAVWQVLGGKLPEEGDPVSYKGPSVRSRSLELGTEERERLRSLGYAN